MKPSSATYNSVNPHHMFSRVFGHQPFSAVGHRCDWLIPNLGPDFQLPALQLGQTAETQTCAPGTAVLHSGLWHRHPFLPDVDKAWAVAQLNGMRHGQYSVFVCVPAGHRLLLQTDPTS